MKCSIQLIKLTVCVDSKLFNEHLSRAYTKASKKGFDIEETDYGYEDNSLIKKGFKIAYHEYKKKKKIRVIIYPGMIFGNSSNELWNTSAKNISKLHDIIEDRVNSYFNNEYSLYDFKMTRVIFASDIDVGSRAKAFDYIKILYNIGKVKCFSPIKRDKENDCEKIDKASCFALEGNSNGIEFWAKHVNNKGILKFEVRLTKHDTICAYADDTYTENQIINLAENSASIFMDTFRYIVPPGDYYKKPKAEKLIRECVKKPELRRRMIRLLELIPEKKSLHLALKSLNYRNFKDVMMGFAEIDVSLVTISKRHEVKWLESLYGYFE